jgi:hypothetical protein
VRRLTLAALSCVCRYSMASHMCCSWTGAAACHISCKYISCLSIGNHGEVACSLDEVTCWRAARYVVPCSMSIPLWHHPPGWGRTQAHV